MRNPSMVACFSLAIAIASTTVAATDLATADDPDRPVLTTGTIDNRACRTDDQFTMVELTGSPVDAPQVLDALADCSIQRIEFTRLMATQDLRALYDELARRFATMGVCSNIVDCAAKIQKFCAERGSTATSSTLSLDAASTATGEACLGTCANGEGIRVFCLWVCPDAKPCV